MKEKEPYIALDMEIEDDARASCGCALTDDGRVIHLDLCPLHAAALALAEALRAWWAFHKESLLPNCDPVERMRLRRIAMNLTPPALKQAGIEE